MIRYLAAVTAPPSAAGGPSRLTGSGGTGHGRAAAAGGAGLAGPLPGTAAMTKELA